MTALRGYAWLAVVAAALILGPSGGAHSGADWEAAYAATDWEEVRRAAEGGDAEAQIELGNAYLEDADVLGGTGELRPDDVQAYLWLSVVKHALLTLHNPARSMGYRADRHRIRAPINTLGGAQCVASL